MPKVCLDRNIFLTFGILGFALVIYLSQARISGECPTCKRCPKCSPCEKCPECPKCPPAQCPPCPKCPPTVIAPPPPSIDKQRIYDPTIEPERSYIPGDPRAPGYGGYGGAGIPINIKTRGEFTRFQKVGTVFKDNEHLALFEKPSDYRRDRYEYYVIDNTRSRNKIKIGDRQDIYELDSGDTVTVPGFSGDFTVQKYDIDEPRYIPYV